MDITKVSQIIDRMPICDDGKKQVRALVEEISGEKFATQLSYQDLGSLWTLGDSFAVYILAQIQMDVYNFICLPDGNRFTDDLKGWDAVTAFVKKKAPKRIPKGERIFLEAK